MNNPIYNNKTRAAMISRIHLECDTSASLYRMTDEELIKVYKEIFETGVEYND